MKLLGYLRVSTAKQGDLGVSLDAQRDLLTRFCAAHDHEVLKVYEEAVSAKTIDKRTEFVAALDRSEKVFHLRSRKRRCNATRSKTAARLLSCSGSLRQQRNRANVARSKSY